MGGGRERGRGGGIQRKKWGEGGGYEMLSGSRMVWWRSYNWLRENDSWMGGVVWFGAKYGGYGEGEVDGVLTVIGFVRCKVLSWVVGVRGGVGWGFCGPE